MIMCVLWQINK